MFVSFKHFPVFLKYFLNSLVSINILFVITNVDCLIDSIFFNKRQPDSPDEDWLLLFHYMLFQDFIQSIQVDFAL